MVRHFLCLVLCMMMACSLIAVPALAEETCVHDYEGSETILKEATCTLNGIAMRICKLCGNKEFHSVPASHRYHEEADLIEEPGCETEGAEYRYCIECNPEKQNDAEGVEKTVLAARHEMCDEVDYLPADCVNPGRFVHICNRCDEVEILDINEDEPALGHQETVKEEAATCENGGKKIVYCKICNAILSEEALEEAPALGHAINEAEPVVILAPTCDEAGYSAYVCQQYASCGYVFEETKAEIAALGHQGIIVPEIEATCKADGRGSKVCDVCGVVMEENVVLPAAEVACTEKEVILRQPTCEAVGIVKVVCEVCEKDLRYQLLPVKHLAGEMVTKEAATCIANGVGEYYCVQCNALLDTVVIESAGHQYGVIPVLTEDCEEGIRATLVCDICQDTKQAAIDLSQVCEEHTLSYSYEMPTCVLPGHLVIQCQECDIPAVKLPFGDDAANGHVYGEDREILLQPTCTQPGEAAYRCLICQQNGEIAAVPALGHSSDWKIVQMSTCLEEGLACEYCVVCGEVLKENVPVPVLEECEDLTIQALLPVSCTEHGVELHTCNVCGAQEYVIIPAAHVPAEAALVVDSTCTAEGKNAIYCSRCGVLIQEEIIPCKDHTYHETADYTTQAACEADGMEYFACTVCNPECDLEKADVVARKISDALGHSFGEEVKHLPATCVDAGRDVKECTVCGAVDVVSLYRDEPALGHVAAYRTEEANCTLPTMLITSCTRCGRDVEAVVIEIEGQENKALGHVPAEEWVLIRETSCQIAGEEKLECVTCGDVIATREIPVCQHKRIDTLVLVEEDCGLGRNMIVMTECEYCKTDMNLRIEPFAHEFDPVNAILTKENSCTQEGEVINVCSICGAEEVEVLPRMQHVSASSQGIAPVVINADCEHGDRVMDVCVLCQEVLSIVPVEGNDTDGHRYDVYDPDLEAMVCIYCHKVAP